MITNWNTIYINYAPKEDYKVGDIFYYEGNDSKVKKFNNLKIKGITYNFGTWLHFDWNEWENNKL